MTDTPSIDLSGWLTEQLGQASPDLLRQMITTFVQAFDGGRGRRGVRRQVRPCAVRSAATPATATPGSSGRRNSL